LPADFVTSASHYDADSDSTRLIMAGRPVYSKHQELGVPLDEARRHEGLRAIAVIPVHHEGRVIACLNVASHTLDEVPAFARNALETIACQIGSSIVHARAEKALQESKERLRAIFESAQDAIFTKDREGHYTRANNACASLLELTTDEIVGKTDFDLFPPDVARRIREQDRRVLEKGEPVSVEDTKPTAGVMQTSHVVKVPLRDANGEIVGICGISRDITERKQAEKDLQASKEYISNIIDSSLDMIIACDMKRHIVEFNTAAQETFGYRPEEVIGKHVDILYADPQESLAVHEITINEGRCVQEILDRRKNGEVFPAFLSASVLRDANGEVVGVMGIARDITERKRAEEALRRRNRELALLNRASQALTSTLDLDQVLTTILEEIRHLLDVTASSVWLIDQETDELVCQQATGPQGESVLGWRLAPGQGLAGWVARAGESLIVPDVWTDERHFKGIDQQTGLPLRSILTVPLRVKNGIIGVLQVMDTQVDRFQPTDLRLAESLATTAAIAIENARLYEQTRQDAETKSVLLDEINHRVKNNLSAIIGPGAGAGHGAQPALCLRVGAPAARRTGRPGHPLLPADAPAR
jgi:PAS domain S-box-containing protein